MLEDFSGHVALLFRAFKCDDVAMDISIDIQAIFYDGEIAIKFAEQNCEQTIIFKANGLGVTAFFSSLFI